MAYKIAYSTNVGAGTAYAETLEEAKEKARELKQNGYDNIEIYDVETGKPVEAS
jgi:hypothetical protein